MLWNACTYLYEHEYTRAHKRVKITSNLNLNIYMNFNECAIRNYAPVNKLFRKIWISLCSRMALVSYQIYKTYAEHNSNLNLATESIKLSV